VMAAAKGRGYRFVSYVSSRALAWPGFTVGENCMVYDGDLPPEFRTTGYLRMAPCWVVS
jgi:hypothetical protein